MPIRLDRLLQYIENVQNGIISWLVAFRGIGWQGTTVAITDAASLVVNCALGETHQITCASDAVRAFALPTNLQAGATFQTEVINTSGAPLTNTTWVAGYLPVNPTLPATGNRRAQWWRWDGTKAHLVVQTAADVAN